MDTAEMHITIWHLITLLLTFFGVVWAFFRVLMAQVEARVMDKFTGIADVLQSLSEIPKDVHRLDTAVLNLRTEIATNYMRTDEFRTWRDTEFRDFMREIKQLLRDLRLAVDGKVDKGESALYQRGLNGGDFHG